MKDDPRPFRADGFFPEFPGAPGADGLRGLSVIAAPGRTRGRARSSA
jgi:hypothetical protein